MNTNVHEQITFDNNFVARRVIYTQTSPRITCFSTDPTLSRTDHFVYACSVVCLKSVKYGILYCDIKMTDDIGGAALGCEQGDQKKNVPQDNLLNFGTVSLNQFSQGCSDRSEKSRPSRNPKLNLGRILVEFQISQMIWN